MNIDVVEKPLCNVLYRQSSLETRLSPIHLTDEESSDEEENVEPKIVDCKIKASQHIKEADELENLIIGVQQFETLNRVIVTELSKEINKTNEKNTFIYNGDDYAYIHKPEFSAGRLKGKRVK